jgi:RNA polymerase sigma factor (sigma-70 family)
MATSQMSKVIQHLRKMTLRQNGADLTDGRLLDSFIERQDEAAFEALVRRHGPTVWGVCRRILRNYHDAEDAFQATFLVLARKAASIVPREMVANWLYGVAYRTALKAQATTGKRRVRERQVTNMPEPEAGRPDAWHDLEPVLDQELARLPDKYRVAIVLCDLEGKTRKEAARQLKIPEGTLSSRLTTARLMLAKRLTRHGLVLSGGSLAVVLAQHAASAGVPASVVSSTIKAVTLVAAGPAAGAGAISAQVAALTEGVLKAMLLTKLKIAAVVLLAVGVFGLGAGVLTHRAQAEKPTAKTGKGEGQEATSEVTGVAKAVDTAKNTITIQLGKGFAGQKTFALARDAKVFLDDGTGDKLGFEEGKLTDLTEGISVTLRLSPNQQEVLRIWAEGPRVQGILKAADAGNNTLTVAVSATKGEPAADKTFPVLKSARLSIDDGKGKDKSKSAKANSLADLPPGAVVFLKLSADQKAVGSIRAEGQSITGVVKAVDAAKNTLTVTVSAAKGEPGVDRTFNVATNAEISINKGKAKDKSQATANSLADLPIGAVATLRLSLDQQAVVAIVAEGPRTEGVLKAVDAGKNSLTVTVTVTKGEPGVDQVISVAKDAEVYIDGVAAKLADLPTDAHIAVQLSADQKAAVAIRAEGPHIFGVVKGNAATDSITVGNKEGDQTFTVAKNARVVIEETKEGKLTDLIDGTVISGKLSADKKEVLHISAEGPSFQGVVKVVDTDKNAITLTIGGKNGVGGEDKSFNLTKDTAVITAINGVPLKLADLRAEKEVVLRLSIDQKAAAKITVLGE